MRTRGVPFARRRDFRRSPWPPWLWGSARVPPFSAATIAASVVLDGLRLTASGIVFGIAGGITAGALMSNLLFGVKALDPISLAGGVATILVVSLLASYLPARRAARVDPTVALRYE